MVIDIILWWEVLCIRGLGGRRKGRREGGRGRGGREQEKESEGGGGEERGREGERERGKESIFGQLGAYTHVQHISAPLQQEPVNHTQVPLVHRWLQCVCAESVLDSHLCTNDT